MESQTEVEDKDIPNTSSDTTDQETNEHSENTNDDNIAVANEPDNSQNVSNDDPASCSDLTPTLSSVETEMEKLHSSFSIDALQAKGVCDLSEKSFILSSSQSISEDLQDILENNGCQEDSDCTSNKGENDPSTHFDEEQTQDKCSGETVADNYVESSAESPDQSRSENVDQSSSDQLSTGNSDQLSAENSDHPSAETLDQSTTDNSDPTAESSDPATAECSDQIVAESSDQATIECSDQTTVESSDQTTVETSDQTTAENADQLKTENSDKSNTENSEQTNTANSNQPEDSDHPTVEISDQSNTESTNQLDTDNSDQLNIENSDQLNIENSDQSRSEPVEEAEQSLPSSSEDPIAEENSDTNVPTVTTVSSFQSSDETSGVEDLTDITNTSDLLQLDSIGIFSSTSDISKEKESISHSESESSPTQPSSSQDESFTSSSVLDSFPSESTDECIIPDTHREFSQAEKEAASSISPLRDLLETNTGQIEVVTDSASTEQNVGSHIRIFKYNKDDLQICHQCKLDKKPSYCFNQADEVQTYICDDTCLAKYKENVSTEMAWDDKQLNLRVKNFSETDTSKDQSVMSFTRKCASCKKTIENIETNLTWEIMDFCNEFCLTKYQKEIGSFCASCEGDVKSNSLGKYCVRFGNDIKQFCSGVCLEKYKKGVKVCSYCQEDMSGEPQGFLAPVGGKGLFKDFCSQVCMEKYDIMTNEKPPIVPAGTNCSVCKADTQITIEYTIDGKTHYCCREPCFVAFSFVNKISSGKCAMCKRHFPKSLLEQYTMYYDNAQYSFCSNSCENIYIIAHRKIVPCSWCKVKKYNFDMIRRYSKEGSVINMCSINCLNLYRVSISAVSSRQISCNNCGKMSHPLYHLTMSDATVRNFCTYDCVMAFQAKYTKSPIVINNVQQSFPVPTGAPRKNKRPTNATDNGASLAEVPQLPVISSVQSLATNGNNATQNSVQNITPINTRTTRSKAASAVTPLNPQIINSYADLPIQLQIKQHFIVRPAPIPEQRNVGTMCYTNKTSKSVTAKPTMVDKAIQTDEKEASKVIIPIPMPIYVPAPMHMFTNFTPVPFPIPVPVPIPVFIPTTSNSSAGIMKQIKKLQVIPSDPYEAEILMMAEMVAEEKKEDTTDSESDVDDHAGPEDSYSPEPVDASNTFGDDMLQMALKMASELDEPAVDLEGALTANTITAPQGEESHGQEDNVDDPQPIHPLIADRSPSVRGRKRGMRQTRGGAKRGRRMSHHQVDMPMMQHQIQQPPPPPEPIEKPDANMCLKFTFGVNAWKQWVTTKNAELEKSGRVMLFKTEILQLTADELNYSLCLFVKEVRKPNGAEYAPDTIYYLCLGIQQYLFENGRIDNIFCDPYYEKFTDCLDEVAKKFSILYNDSHYIVTRVEEEHLWESKQLGAHSPHVLLSTLMFFNTKHFNLTTVDEHMQLSFSHIMKHWKRNPNQPGAAKVPGSRNVLLRFYPPQSAIQNNTRKKKVYEQQENEENPLRCPVKLYEFYLSKCPESVKTRNDVFYLQPERSCIPDSPVWYSTMPLPKEALEKMLHRVKMVKEINVALLTS